MLHLFHSLTPSYITPQHALILLTNTLAVFYLALTVFLAYLFVLQLYALTRTYAPLRPITTLVQLETAWTLVPIAFIATCSLCTAAFLQYADVSSSYTPFTHTLHVEGAQWYWRFNGDDLRLLTLPPTLQSDYFGLPRLALTASIAALPVHQSTLFTVTSPDVIHSLSIPALSVKLDCIPGRLSQCSPHLSTVGTYIGYCAELCGLGHSAMPLTLTVYTPTTALLPTIWTTNELLLWNTLLTLTLFRTPTTTVTTPLQSTAIFHRISRDYAIPLHLSPWHSLGFFVGIAIASQLVTGFILACQYSPGFVEGYNSVRYLINDTAFGYLVQSLHANGAAIVMASLFLHMLRTLWYGHTTPRLSLYGFVILILLIAVCFTGYTLAACQMSYWAAAVIFRMLSVIPLVGDRLADYILAGPTPWSMTIRRIFTVHVILPFVTLAVIMAHVLELHTAGSVGDFTTRLELTRTDELDFHRLVWARDLLATLLYVWCAYLLVFVYPEWLLHPDTWVPANPLVTPLSIQPEWYFMLLYSILRAIPHKGLGMLTLVLFIWSFYALYHLNRTNESRSRILTNRTTLLLVLVDFLVISYLCTHLHHYDTYFALMLYLAIATHLLYLHYHLAIYVPRLTPPLHTTTQLQRHTPTYPHLTLHIQSQEGPKLPSYWLLAVLLWFLVITHLLLSLSNRNPELTHLLPLTILWLTLLATLSANYDAYTWTTESTRNMYFGFVCILLFEGLLFVSLYAMITGVTLDENVPRYQSIPTHTNLYETIPVTTLSLLLLLFVTWYTHAAWSTPYQLTSTSRYLHPQLYSLRTIPDPRPYQQRVFDDCGVHNLFPPMLIYPFFHVYLLDYTWVSSSVVIDAWYFGIYSLPLWLPTLHRYASYCVYHLFLDIQHHQQHPELIRTHLQSFTIAALIVWCADSLPPPEILFPWLTTHVTDLPYLGAFCLAVWMIRRLMFTFGLPLLYDYQQLRLTTHTLLPLTIYPNPAFMHLLRMPNQHTTTTQPELTSLPTNCFVFTLLVHSKPPFVRFKPLYSTTTRIRFDSPLDSPPTAWWHAIWQRLHALRWQATTHYHPQPVSCMYGFANALRNTTHCTLTTTN